MNVAIVFPVSLCLPNQIYYSLPLLSGALRRAGHEPHAVDLNVMAADMFLERRRSEEALAAAHRMVSTEREAGRVATADGLGAMLETMEEKLLDGERCRDILRDRVRCFDQPLFKHAFWNVVDCLAFYYQHDPIISPHRTTFGADMVAHQEADPWTPLVDLYEAAMVDAVLSSAPGLVAISVAFPEQAAESVRLARLIRKRAPDVHIAFGGPLLGNYPESWLQDEWIFRYADTVCLGDGERTIVQLANLIATGGDRDAVRNLVWMDGRMLRRNDPEPVLESMEDAPVPDFDGADMSLYLTPGPIYPIMVSRGCYWGRCTFCSLGWRENYRQASYDKLRKDVLAVAARPDARYLQVQDSSIPPNGARNLARIIEEEGLDLAWTAGLKFEKVLLNPEYCEELAAGGCRSFLMGFESSTQRVLDLMDKGYEIEELPRMLENLRAAGISAELLWFIGFPSETRREALDTAEYLYRHRHLFGLTAFVGDYLLHPDTIVFDRPEEFGVTVIGHDNDNCNYVVTEGMQPDEVRVLKKLLACNNNRTLVCNGAHLPHIAEGGLDLSGLERPMTIAPEVREFCS